MINAAGNDLSNLMIARRLMEVQKDVEARRNGKHVEEKTALDYYKEDQALISDAAMNANENDPQALPPIENLNIKLPDFRKKAQEIVSAAQPDAQPTQAAAV